jgi:hypothetical protein
MLFISLLMYFKKYRGSKKVVLNIFRRSPRPNWILYRIVRDRLGLGDMYAPEASNSDSNDDDNPGQASTAHAPGNSPPPWE